VKKKEGQSSFSCFWYLDKVGSKKRLGDGRKVLLPRAISLKRGGGRKRGSSSQQKDAYSLTRLQIKKGTRKGDF